MQFLAPRVVCKFNRFAHGTTRPVHVGRVSRCYATSNVVAVLRTSKFRRLCGEYIKGATPDPGGMAAITEERDRLSNLGLLDERSTELYNHAWQVSQSPAQPPKTTPSLFYPEYTYPFPLPSFPYMPPTYMPSPPNNQEQSPYQQVYEYPLLSPPSLLSQFTPPSSTPPSSPPSPSPPSPPSPSPPSPTSDAQPAQQERTLAEEFAEALDKEKYHRIMYFFRRLNDAGTSPTPAQHIRVIVLAAQKNYIEACKTLLRDFADKHSYDQIVEAHYACLAEAVKVEKEKVGLGWERRRREKRRRMRRKELTYAKGTKEETAVEVIEVLRQKKLLIPSRLIVLIHKASSQALANKLAEAAEVQLKPTGTPLEPGDQALYDHITKSNAIQRAVPKLFKISLEYESLKFTSVLALATDFAKHCDFEGCKLLFSRTDSPPLWKALLGVTKKHLVEGSCEDSVKAQAKEYYDSPRTTTLLAAMSQIFYNIDKALEMYEQLRANPDPEMARVTLSLITRFIIILYKEDRLDMVEKILADYKEHKNAIYIGCVPKVRNDKEGHILGARFIEELNKMNENWLNEADPYARFVIFKFAIQSKNKVLVAKCIKAWKPYEKFHLDPNHAPIKRSLYFHLVNSEAIKREPAGEFCLQAERRSEVHYRLLSALFEDLARHGDVKGCGLVHALSQQSRHPVRDDILLTFIRQHLSDRRWESRRENTMRLITRIQRRSVQSDISRARSNPSPANLQSQGNLQQDTSQQDNSQQDKSQQDKSQQDDNAQRSAQKGNSQTHNSKQEQTSNNPQNPGNQYRNSHREFQKQMWGQNGRASISNATTNNQQAQSNISTQNNNNTTDNKKADNGNRNANNNSNTQQNKPNLSARPTRNASTRPTPNASTNQRANSNQNNQQRTNSRQNNYQRNSRTPRYPHTPQAPRTHQSLPSSQTASPSPSAPSPSSPPPNTPPPSSPSPPPSSPSPNAPPSSTPSLPSPNSPTSPPSDPRRYRPRKNKNSEDSKDSKPKTTTTEPSQNVTKQTKNPEQNNIKTIDPNPRLPNTTNPNQTTSSSQAPQADQAEQTISH